MSRPLVSIIIPAYNEERRIGRALEQVRAYLAGRFPYEVLVVDDGSTDRTPAIAGEHASRDPAVRLVRRPAHQGKGAAVREGMLSAGGDVVCFMDADLSTPVDTLKRMVPLLTGGADVVIASRALATSELAQRQHPVRELMGKVFNRAVRTLFRLPYRDTQCGCKGFRRAAAQAVFSRSVIDGFAFDVEALALARALTLTVAELPVRWTDSKPSRVRIVSHPAQMWGELWRIRRNLRRGAYRLNSASGKARQRVSAVILTKNEEARIIRCLESIAWADELVIVDGVSTDRTVEICQRYGATVISHPFCGDFGHERNLGNEAATGEWILQLDADDAVSPRLRESIERVLREDSPHHAFKFRRRNWFLGHEMLHGGWYHYYPHFFRRGRAHFEGRVHHLLISPEPPAIMDGDLEHRPFDSLEQFISRHNRYTAIEAEELFQRDGASLLAQARWHVARRPFKLFWKTYIRKQGFRDGWHGLVFSVLFAWVHLMKWAKYWEECQSSRSITERVRRQNEQTTAAARELFERHGTARPWSVWIRVGWKPAVTLWRASRSRQPDRELIDAQLTMFGQVMAWAKYWDLSRRLVAAPQEASAPAVEVMHAVR